MRSATPQRGELYFANLDPTTGREQAGDRPFLILSLDEMNRAALRVVIGLPVTTTARDNPLHVKISPAESGLPRVSYAMPEMLRSISTQRLRRRTGRVPQETLERAARHAGFLVGLGETRF